MNPPLDNPFAPPEADASRIDPGLVPRSGESGGAQARATFFGLLCRWEGCRLLYDATLLLLFWGLACFDHPRFWHVPARSYLPLIAIVLNVAFTFGPVVTWALRSDRPPDANLPACLAVVGVATALAAVLWEISIKS